MASVTGSPSPRTGLSLRCEKLACSLTRVILSTSPKVSQSPLFTEGFSVTTLEALSLGCLPVIVGADALQEVYGEHVPTVKAPYAVNKYEYIDVLERALVDDKWYDVQRERALQLREVFCWDRTAPKFLQELSEISLVNP